MTDDVNPATGDYGGEASPGFVSGLQNFGSGLLQQFTTPGAAMQPNPYPQGSEEATWYDQNRQDVMNQWAPGMALNMVGTGTQFAEPGALGVAGGKLTNSPRTSTLAEDSAMRSTYGVSMDRLPQSASLNLPSVPTADVMAKSGRVESVPLEMARGTQPKMEWGKFNSGEHPPPLIEGYADKPVAVRREDGEYLVYDGHHRAVLAANSGAKNMDMYVVDAKSYAPEAAGRAPTKAKSGDDDALMRELFGIGEQ